MRFAFKTGEALNRRFSARSEAEINRKGGLAIVAFSNRCFLTKLVAGRRVFGLSFSRTFSSGQERSEKAVWANDIFGKEWKRYPFVGKVWKNWGEGRLASGAFSYSSHS